MFRFTTTISANHTSMTPGNHLNFGHLLRAFADVRASLQIDECFISTRSVENPTVGKSTIKFRIRFSISIEDSVYMLIIRFLCTNGFTLIHKTYLNFILEIRDSVCQQSAHPSTPFILSKVCACQRDIWKIMENHLLN